MDERTGTQAAKMVTRKAISKNAWQRAVRVNPKTLILRGTRNVAVVDASLIPTIVPAHPVGTIMAVADRAGDILTARWS